MKYTLPTTIKLKKFGWHRLFRLHYIEIEDEEVTQQFIQALQYAKDGGFLFGQEQNCAEDKEKNPSTLPYLFRCFFSSWKLPGICQYFENPNRATLSDFR